VLIRRSKTRLKVKLRPPNKSSLRSMRLPRILESAASDHACQDRPHQGFHQHPNRTTGAVQS
jgi:hypothetical protein